MFDYIAIYLYVCIVNEEQIIQISKALGNPTRLNILKWIRNPKDNFPDQDLGHFEDGVCASFIKDKTKLSQPTISSFLSIMEKAGLLISTRHGKWTYFRRNEMIIKQYTEEISRKY